MKNLLAKEFKLALHPTAPMFVAFVLMLFIPSYPYEVVYFYGAMAVFFTCLLGRENNDVFYTVSLPVSKKAVVQARFAYAIILELAQIVLSIPVIVIKTVTNMPANAAALDANVALFGVMFLLFGIFNLVFFHNYYRNVNKVGKSFLIASVAMFLLVLVDEILVFAVPYVRDVIDTPDPANLAPKFVVLAIGLVAYCVMTLAAYRDSVKNFEKTDL